MKIAVSVIFLVMGALQGVGALFCAVAAPLTAVMITVEDNPNDPPWWFGLIVYGSLALLFGTSAGVQLSAGVRTLKGRGWLHGIVASVIGIVLGLMCCNIVGLMAGIATLIMLTLPQLRDELNPPDPWDTDPI